jgi:hypothetical protein
MTAGPSGGRVNSSATMAPGRPAVRAGRASSGDRCGDGVEVGGDDVGEQVGLARVVVEGRLGDAAGIGDLAHGRAVESPLDEEVGGLAKEALT